MFTPRQRRKWKGRGLPRRETGRDREAPPLLPPSAAPPSRHGKGERGGDSPLSVPPPRALLPPGGAALSHPPGAAPRWLLHRPPLLLPSGRFRGGWRSGWASSGLPGAAVREGPRRCCQGRGRGGLAWRWGAGGGGGLCPGLRRARERAAGRPSPAGCSALRLLPGFWAWYLGWCLQRECFRFARRMLPLDVVVNGASKCSSGI